MPNKAYSYFVDVGERSIRIMLDTSLQHGFVGDQMGSKFSWSVDGLSGEWVLADDPLTPELHLFALTIVAVQIADALFKDKDFMVQEKHDFLALCNAEFERFHMRVSR